MKHLFIFVFCFLFLIWLSFTNTLLISHRWVFSLAYPTLMYPEKISFEQSQKASNIVRLVHSAEQFSYLSVEENRHMNDVQLLFQTTSHLWVLILVGLLCFYFLLTHFFVNVSSQMILKLLMNTTVLFIGFIGVSTLFFWNSSFILFHRLLFDPGTWSFPTDSTLIQLFPETFWQHMFTVLLIMPVIEVLTLKQCAKYLRRTHNFSSNGTIPQ